MPWMRRRDVSPHTHRSNTTARRVSASCGHFNLKGGTDAPSWPSFILVHPTCPDPTLGSRPSSHIDTQPTTPPPPSLPHLHPHPHPASLPHQAWPKPPSPSCASLFVLRDRVHLQSHHRRRAPVGWRGRLCARRALLARPGLLCVVCVPVPVPVAVRVLVRKTGIDPAGESCFQQEEWEDRGRVIGRIQVIGGASATSVLELLDMSIRLILLSVLAESNPLHMSDCSPFYPAP